MCLCSWCLHFNYNGFGLFDGAAVELDVKFQNNLKTIIIVSCDFFSFTTDFFVLLCKLCICGYILNLY